MRKSQKSLLLLATACGAVCAWSAYAQDIRPPAAPGPSPYKLEEAYLQWPVAAADKKYTAIDGHHLHAYVEEAAQIGARYRDAGHQLWGRIMGTESDKETADWMEAKLKAAGIDTTVQTIDLPPQWVAASWTVSAAGAGKTLKFSSLMPATRSVGTGGKTLDLEVAYGGLGTESDFQGRDVKGKAVLIYSRPQVGVWGNSGNYDGAANRARAHGAAAVIMVVALPGNLAQAIGIFRDAAGAKASTDPEIPGFTMGLEDGEALRALIEQSPDNAPAHLSVNLDARMVPGQKTYEVRGVLPGMTDEKIIVVAHRDGYFYAAGDNASGMATLLGLAEYFAKVPKAKRRRTILFFGSSGHHGTQVGVQYLADHKDTELKNVALVMNAEHTALTQQYQFAGRIRAANTTNAEHWSYNGSGKVMDIALDALKSFGVATYEGTDRVSMAEIIPVYKLAPSFGMINVDTFYHTDGETPATVPWTGLASVTRAYAKIIDGVNKYGLSELQPPPDLAQKQASK